MSTQRKPDDPPFARLDTGARPGQLLGFETVRSSMTDPNWFLYEENYEPALEHELESRFTVGNGFIGIRGSLDIPTEASRPRTYVAGLFDVRAEPPALSFLVPAPHAFGIRLSVDGQQLDIGSGSIQKHARLLAYHQGVLHSIWRQELPSGLVVSMESLRFASRSRQNLALQLLRLRLEQPAQVAIYPWEIDGHHLSQTGDPLVWRTRNRSRALARLQQVRLQVDAKPRSDWRQLSSLGATFPCQRDLTLEQITTYGLALRDEEAKSKAQQSMSAGMRSGIHRLHRRHIDDWGKRWDFSDVVVEGDEEAQQALRFAIYHLNSAADPALRQTSIGARGLTGDGYLGHVFWDTDIFMLPFYTLTWPEAARRLLEYRFNTLPAARAKARRFGFRGAFYAWESTDTGEEVTPSYVIGPHGEVIAIRNGELEQHVSAAVAYGTWQYWQATRDIKFLLSAGAEILLDTARFWASRSQPEGDGLYHIRSVIGPDEYHEAIDDNAYTNAMARWNIERGLEVSGLLKKRWPETWRHLADELSLDESETETWRTVARLMYVPQDPASGLIEQFAGYFGLEFIDLSAFAERSAPMDVLLGPERTRRSQVIKQADVLMLLALLPDALTPDLQQRNFEYYEPRCGHGSSLSPPIHSLVAARLGKLEFAERYFRETAAIDLSDSMGNSAAGLHMAALGGLWQAAVFGFGGVLLRPDGIAIDPHLPVGWERLRFPILWRGRRLQVEVSRNPPHLTVTLTAGRPMTIYADRGTHRLERAGPLVMSLMTEQEAG